jgi:hypothetical protein
MMQAAQAGQVQRIVATKLDRIDDNLEELAIQQLIEHGKVLCERSTVLRAFSFYIIQRSQKLRQQSQALSEQHSYALFQPSPALPPPAPVTISFERSLFLSE